MTASKRPKHFSVCSLFAGSLFLLAGCSAGELSGGTSPDDGAPVTGGMGSSTGDGVGGTAPIWGGATGGSNPDGAGGSWNSTGGASETGGTTPTGGETAAGGTSTGGGVSATGGNGSEPTPDCSGGVEGRGIGDKARDFTVTDADGGTIRLSDYCGRVVVLEVSSPECGKCARNARELPEFAANYSVDDVVFMTAMYEGSSPEGQNNGTIPTPEEINLFVKNTPLTPSFYDDSMWGRFEFTDGGTPSLVIIGKDRMIKYFGGGESHEDYKPALDAALAE